MLDDGNRGSNLPSSDVPDRLIGIERVADGIFRTVSSPIEAIANLVAALAVKVTRATRAELFSTPMLDYPAWTGAEVVADTNLAYRGIYIKAGDSGTGSWTRVADLRTGPKGDNGAAYELRVQAGVLQGRNVGAPTWINLYVLSQLVGEEAFTREQADDALADLIAQKIKERVDAHAALAAALEYEAGTRSDEVTALNEALESEANTRSNAITGLNNAIGNVADDLSLEAETRGAADTTLTNENNARKLEIASLGGRVDRINAGVYPGERPGDNPSAFTSSSDGGDPNLLPPLDLNLYPIRRVADGKGIEISGSRELWMRKRFVIETGRLGRVRVRFVRTENPRDPLDDAVSVLGRWFDKNDQPATSVLTLESSSPKVGDPAHEFKAYVGVSGQADVTIVRPPGGVYFVVGVIPYGSEGKAVVTDLGVTELSDVDAAVIRLSPPDAVPAVSARLNQEVGFREAADTALGGRIDTEEEVREAADTLIAANVTDLTERLDTAFEVYPLFQGYEAIAVDPDGRAHIAATPDGLFLARMREEPTERLPITRGWDPLATNRWGGISLGLVDGVLFAPGSLARPLAEPVLGLGQQQVMVTGVDPVTLAPYTQQVTWGQQSDLQPREALGPDLISVSGPDARYPVGAVKAWPRQPASNKLLILAVIGQSNAAGISGDSLGVEDPTKITLQAPMPGTVLCFNGGVFPRQLGAGSGAINIRITSDRYTSVIDAYEFIPASSSQRESLTTAAAEVLAAALSQGTRVLVFNLGVSGSKLELLIGEEGSDAAQWLNVRDLVTAATSYATANGLVAEVAGLILNQGEANDSDAASAYLGRLNTLRSKTNALKSLTGQSSEIPIVVCQVNATKNETGAVSDATLVQEQWCADAANYAGLVPLYFSRTNDVATVHHLAEYHRYIGETCGHVLADLRFLSVYRHVRAKAAIRQGRRVAVQMSEPVVIDRYGVPDPGMLGISYQDSAGAVAVSGVEVDGDIVRLTLGATPSGTGEAVRIGCSGAKFYAATSRYGLGIYGNRSCLRAPEPHWSHSTGRPLWRWAAQQSLSVSIIF